MLRACNNLNFFRLLHADFSLNPSVPRLVILACSYEKTLESEKCEKQLTDTQNLFGTVFLKMASVCTAESVRFIFEIRIIKNTDQLCEIGM